MKYLVAVVGLLVSTRAVQLQSQEHQLDELSLLLQEMQGMSQILENEDSSEGNTSGSDIHVSDFSQYKDEMAKNDSKNGNLTTSNNTKSAPFAENLTKAAATNLTTKKTANNQSESKNSSKTYQQILKLKNATMPLKRKNLQTNGIFEEDPKGEPTVISKKDLNDTIRDKLGDGPEDIEAERKKDEKREQKAEKQLKEEAKKLKEAKEKNKKEQAKDHEKPAHAKTAKAKTIKVAANITAKNETKSSNSSTNEDKKKEKAGPTDNTQLLLEDNKFVKSITQKLEASKDSEMALGYMILAISIIIGLIICLIGSLYCRRKYKQYFRDTQAAKDVPDIVSSEIYYGMVKTNNGPSDGTSISSSARSNLNDPRIQSNIIYQKFNDRDYLIVNQQEDIEREVEEALNNSFGRDVDPQHSIRRVYRNRSSDVQRR